MEYIEQLKDKRWRKKRYLILVRDNHTCQICGYIGPNVNVHHKKYTGMAWEAPEEDLITLCCHCHRTTHMPQIMDKKYEAKHIKNIICHG